MRSVRRVAHGALPASLPLRHDWRIADEPKGVLHYVSAYVWVPTRVHSNSFLLSRSSSDWRPKARRTESGHVEENCGKRAVTRRTHKCQRHHQTASPNCSGIPTFTHSISLWYPQKSPQRGRFLGFG